MHFGSGSYSAKAKSSGSRGSVYTTLGTRIKSHPAFISGSGFQIYSTLSGISMKIAPPQRQFLIVFIFLLLVTAPNFRCS
jgi:hypothetical protein